VHKEQCSIDMITIFNVNKSVKIDAEKEVKHHRTAYFETFVDRNIFFAITDIKLVKYLCPHSSYSRQLKKRDEIFIPFVLSHYLLNIENYQYEFLMANVMHVVGYMKLHEIMADDEMREKIEKRFGFTIADFRKIYSTPHKVKHYHLKNNTLLNIFPFMCIQERERGFYLNICNVFKTKVWPKLKNNEN
jgi:hypothetical protein